MKSASSKTKSPSQRGKLTRSRSRSRGRKTRSRSRSPARKPIKKEVKSNSVENDTRARSKIQNVEVDVTDHAVVRRGKSQKTEADKAEQSNVTQQAKTFNLETNRSDQPVVQLGKITNVEIDREEHVVHRRKALSVESDRSEHLTVSCAGRSSARIAALQTAKVLASATSPAVSRELNEKASKLLLEDSESEEEYDEEKHLPKKYSLGALLQIILMPCLVICLHLICTKYHCTLWKFPVFTTTLSHYLDGEAFLIYLGWIFLQALFMLIPVGSVVEGFPYGSKNTVLKYRLNGFLALVLTSLILAGLAYYKVPLTVVHDKFLALMTTSIIFSIFSSLLMYLKARRAPDHALNPAASTGYVLYDFFYGRELHPRFGIMFDLRFLVFRLGMITWAAINMCLVYKYFIIHNYVNTSLAVTVFCQLFYIVDFFWREEALLSTASFLYEGMGYELILGLCTLVPFIYTIPSMHLMYRAKVLPHWCLAASGILFLCGYFIYMRANNLKHAFRRNPYHPSLAHLESIPTSKKRRLITSGWWGFVQHPNYLGDIIMAMAWSLPCGFGHAVPLFPALFIILFLMARSVQIGNDCRKRYGPAWERYTQQVPYRIFPYIF